MPLKLHLRLASALLLSIACLPGCSKEEKEPTPLVTVQVAPVQQQELNRVVTTEAILFPIQQAAITPKITAPVRKFYVNRGSRVHQGQLLAELENKDLQGAEQENKGAYEQAQGDYQNATAANLPQEIQKSELDVQSNKEALGAAQKLFDSRQTLFNQGALPRKDLDQASVQLIQAKSQYQVSLKHLQDLQAIGQKATMQSAQGQLSSAKGKYMSAAAQLGYSEIRSPIDGIVTDRPTWVGETPPAGTPLLTIMNTSQVTARAHIPQQDAALLKNGDPATLSSPESPEVEGKVALVSPALDPNSTTVEVWVQAANPKGQLRPGSTVRLSITAQTVKDALVIPAAALLTAPDGSTSVMVAGSDGLAHQQPVEVGIKQADEVQITKGLKPGDKVVAQGAYGLPDKTKIKIAEAAPEKPSPDKKDAGDKDDKKKDD